MSEVMLAVEDQKEKPIAAAYPYPSPEIASIYDTRTWPYRLYNEVVDRLGYIASINYVSSKPYAAPKQQLNIELLNESFLIKNIQEHAPENITSLFFDNSNRELLDKQQRRAIKHTSHKEHRLKRTVSTISATALALTTLYVHDINTEKERLSHTNSRIIDVYDAESAANDNTWIIESAGWGNLNSYNTAVALPSLGELGNVGALHYDNRGVYTATIANQIIETAQEKGYTKIAFAGSSMGGLVSLELARLIQESETDLSVPFIFLDCTPANVDVLRPAVRDNGYNMAGIVSSVPGAQYSRSLRFLAEMGARYREFVDLNAQFGVDSLKLRNVIKYVLDNKILSDDVASTQLLASQFKMIVGSGAESDISLLGEDNNGKPRPIIIAMIPSDKNADGTVNNEASVLEFAEYAKAANLLFMVVPVDGIHHADPIQTPEEHNNAINETIVPIINTHTQLQDLFQLSMSIQNIATSNNPNDAEILTPEEQLAQNEDGIIKPEGPPR